MSKQKQQDQSPTCTSHASSTESFQYGNHFEGLIQKLHSEGRYRVFADLQREVGIFPRVHHQSQASEEAAPSREVTVWCSNDYLGMGHNRVVLQAMHDALDVYGAGSGGTRNISGNHVPIVRLERELASLYGMGAGLVCTSGYVANVTGLSTIARQLPGCIVFSDSENHASMIQGIRGSKAKKFVFEHNDVDHLERLIRDVPAETPKLIAFESVYSMSGDFGPIAEICEVAKRYNALTFLDETHAVGLYGSNGAGLAQEQGLVDQIDIIQGSFGKGYGVVGGFLVGSSVLIDVIRSYGTGFIFTTSLPPTIAAGALASVRYLRESSSERTQHQANARLLKKKMKSVGLPILETPSHIIPLMVRNSGTCKAISDYLMNEESAYIQPINYPTVPAGSERLRITPTPLHTEEQMDQLVQSLLRAWEKFGLNLEFEDAPSYRVEWNEEEAAQ